MRGRASGWRGAWVLAGIALVACASPPAHALPSPADLHFPSDSTLNWSIRKLVRGESLERLFGDHWRDVARFNRIDRRHAVAGVRLRVPDRLDAIECFTPLPLAIDSERTEPRFVLVDLSEQFLGAYEFGRLVWSAPTTTGNAANPTPTGDFRITHLHRDHRSNLYTIEGTNRPYPMDWALRFLTSREGVGYWIHGRDLPGFPASHGCIGLSDEAMQRRCYGVPGEPIVEDARTLYEWVAGAPGDSVRARALVPGVKMRVVGVAPAVRAPRATRPPASTPGPPARAAGDSAAGRRR
jgi:lipoprotein-anchoring transpeptidase ErfK/SrfK